METKTRENIQADWRRRGGGGPSNQHEGLKHKPSDSINTAKQRRFTKQNRLYRLDKLRQVKVTSGSSYPTNWIFSEICGVAVNRKIQNLE